MNKNTKAGNISEVSIYSKGRPVVRYWKKQDSPAIVTSEILVDAGRTDDKLGFVVVDGINDFIPRYFWVFLENLYQSNEVCILKQSPVSVSSFHSDCSDEGAIRVECGSDAPPVGNVTCRHEGDWLKVRLEPPAIVWQINEEKPFEMWLRSSRTDGSRMKGVTICTDENGPDCSNINCSPGVDSSCIAIRNICRFGTGPCSRLDWLRAEEISIPDPPLEPCDYPGTCRECTVGVCTGRQCCRSDRLWTACRPTDRRLEPEKCDSIDNDCDGRINEDPDYGAPWLMRYPLMYPRKICDDSNICTNDWCQTMWFHGQFFGSCLHSPAPSPPDPKPECTEWACHSAVQEARMVSN
jgi:hypothetical protein